MYKQFGLLGSGMAVVPRGKLGGGYGGYRVDRVLPMRGGRGDIPRGATHGFGRCLGGGAHGLDRRATSGTFRVVVVRGTKGEVSKVSLFGNTVGGHKRVLFFSGVGNNKSVRVHVGLFSYNGRYLDFFHFQETYSTGSVNGLYGLQVGTVAMPFGGVQRGGDVYGTIQHTMGATRIVHSDVGVTSVDTHRYATHPMKTLRRVYSYFMVLSIVVDLFSVVRCGLYNLFNLLSYLLYITSTSMDLGDIDRHVRAYYQYSIQQRACNGFQIGRHRFQARASVISNIFLVDFKVYCGDNGDNFETYSNDNKRYGRQKRLFRRFGVTPRLTGNLVQLGGPYDHGLYTIRQEATTRDSGTLTTIFRVRFTHHLGIKSYKIKLGTIVGSVLGANFFGLFGRKIGRVGTRGTFVHGGGRLISSLTFGGFQRSWGKTFTFGRLQL